MRRLDTLERECAAGREETEVLRREFRSRWKVVEDLEKRVHKMSSTVGEWKEEIKNLGQSVRDLDQNMDEIYNNENIWGTGDGEVSPGMAYEIDRDGTGLDDREGGKSTGASLNDIDEGVYVSGADLVGEGEMPVNPEGGKGGDTGSIRKRNRQVEEVSSDGEEVDVKPKKGGAPGMSLRPKGGVPKSKKRK